MEEQRSHEVLRSSWAWSECEAEAMKSVQAAANSKSAERASKLYKGWVHLSNLLDLG